MTGTREYSNKDDLVTIRWGLEPGSRSIAGALVVDPEALIRRQAAVLAASSLYLSDDGFKQAKIDVSKRHLTEQSYSRADMHLSTITYKVHSRKCVTFVSFSRCICFVVHLGCVRR